MNVCCFRSQNPQRSINQCLFRLVLALIRSRRGKMNETKETEETDIQTDAVPADAATDKDEFKPSERKQTLRNVFANLRRPPTATTKSDLKQDRTRALLLMLGGIVGAVLLFLGV